MPFKIVHNDITNMNTDAIVRVNNFVGHAVITKGYNLPAKYIIHAVGPVWKDGLHGEAKLLASFYKSSLELAKEYKLKSISFPLISAGIYGYPKKEALQIAISTISEFLMENEMDVYLVVYDRKVFELSSKLSADIEYYIDTYYEPDDLDRYERRRKQKEFERIYEADEYILKEFRPNIPITHEKSISIPRSLEDALKNLDETFSEMLLRLIDEKGKTDVEVYKKANIDRRLFSKIRNNKHYNPKKATVLAFAIALELSLDETIDLLAKTGYALSNSSKFDLIIEYFIKNKNYDIFTINEALFYYDQPLLG